MGEFGLWSIIQVSSLISCTSLVRGVSPETNILSPQLDTLIKYQLPEGSNVPVSVYDLTVNKTLYDYQVDKLSRPASVMKLLTTIMALVRPEVDELSNTEVWHKGVIKCDMLKGNIYVVGGLGPGLNDEALDSLVSGVVRLLFLVVQSKVYGDVSMKGSSYWESGWSRDDTPYSFQPYLSPLMLDKGVVMVAVPSGVQGSTARLEYTPASSYYIPTNVTKSRTPSAGSFRVSRNWLENGNDITASGNVDGRRIGAVNVCSSQDPFMHMSLERLQAKDIRCLPDCSFGEFRKDSISVRMVYYNTPVQVVANQVTKKSDDLNAEAMLCRLNAQPAGNKYVLVEDGLSEIRQLIRRLDYVPDHYKLIDGCGLSNYNYISSELLVAFPKFTYSRIGVFQKLYKALSTDGVGGTLKNWMKKGTPSYKKVHVKMGPSTAIDCLAEYLEADNGHQVIFAVMNQNMFSGREARRFQGVICDILIR